MPYSALTAAIQKTFAQAIQQPDAPIHLPQKQTARMRGDLPSIEAG
jgi:hypothetical protein